LGEKTKEIKANQGDTKKVHKDNRSLERMSAREKTMTGRACSLSKEKGAPYKVGECLLRGKHAKSAGARKEDRRKKRGIEKDTRG